MIHANVDDRAIAHVTIDRPERRNALDRESMAAIADALAGFERTPHVRAVVVSGRGGTFSAGRDLKEAGDLPLEAALDQHAAWTDVYRRLRRLRCPSVAVVEGHAVAGGFTLAMGCDFVLAERTAQFGAMEMRNGFPAAVCTPIMARLAGPRVGLELVLFGEAVSAERLFEVGLVNQLADGAQGLETLLAGFLDRIVALDAGAVAQTLETYRAAETMPLDQSLTMGMHLNQLLDASGAFQRGSQVFAGRQREEP